MGLLKQLLFFSAFILIGSTTVFASHIVGSEIRVSHVQNWDYKVELFLYRDAAGISAPFQADIKIYERSSAQLKRSIIVLRDSFYLTSPNSVGCGSPILQVETHSYSKVITLDPNVFTDLQGYYFVWSSCCRNPGIVNIINSSGQGASAVTLIPPISTQGGFQIINSSPVLNSPVTDFALNGRLYSQDFGGYDPDGDSLAYRLYRPFIENNPTPGFYTGLFSNGKDPYTQFTPVNWASCYNDTNQINGISNPACNSLNEPDRLKIDPITGELTTNPGSPPSVYYVFGIRCLEYRNGVLIGSIFRDFQLSIKQNNLSPNSEPTVHLPQLQTLATWDADTMVFTGSPVCVQLGVTDPDPIADIEIVAVYSDYDPGDLTFVQNSAIILNPDTFQTALCFQPDSFLPYTTRGDVVALNPGCYDLRGDTLPFYFKFVGYSNAGWGGTQTIAMSNVSGNVDLFSMLNHNPNAGGQWIEITNSGRLQANGMFNTSTLPIPSTYEFYYIDQQPNYPSDTAYLKVNFIQTTALGIGEVQEINIYPNPANDVLTISGISDKAVFEIFDIQGKKIKAEILDGSNNSINTTEFREGLYFYQLNNQRGKFLIQR